MTLLGHYSVSLNTPSGAGSYTGDLRVYQKRQDVVANTSVIGWEFSISKLTGDGRYSNQVNNWAVVVNGNIVDYGDFRYNFDTVPRVGLPPMGSTIMVSSGEVTVAHGTNGTKAINAYANYDDDSNNLQVFSVGVSNPVGIGLTTLARATKPAVSPNPVEAGKSVTISLPRANSAFTHDVTYTVGALSGTIATGVATSTTWTPAPWVPGTLLRTNLWRDPRAVNVVSGGQFTSGGGEVVSQISDFPGSISTAARFTRNLTGNQRIAQMVMGTSFPAAGQTITVRMMARSSQALTGVQVSARPALASAAGAALLGTINIASGVSEIILTAPSFTAATTATSAITFIHSLAGTGQTLDITGVTVEVAPTFEGYFDGSTTPDAGPGVTYAWTGTANNSTSTQRQLTPSTTFFDQYPGRPEIPVVITATTKNGATVIGSDSVTLILKAYQGPPQIGGEDFDFDVRVKRVEYNAGVWEAVDVIPASSVQLVDSHSATGTCSVEVSQIVAADFEEYSIVDIEVYNGKDWISPGQRFVLSRVQTDGADLSNTATYTGTNFVDFMLGKAYTQQKYTWDSATPGTILSKLIADAKSRSWGPRIEVDFTNTATSLGTAWTNTTVKREITPGTPISQILEGLVSDGLVEYRTRYTNNKAYLELFNPGTGADWAVAGANPVVNFATAELSRAPRRGTIENRVTRITVAGDAELRRTRERPALDSNVMGQLEGWVTASGIDVAAEADKIGDNALADASVATDERTFEFSTVAVDRHFWPYYSLKPGDWVLIPVRNSAPQRARIGQITIDKQSDDLTITVLTGDRILSGEGALAKRQQVATGGAIPGGNLSNPNTIDTRIPAAPVISTITSVGYWNSDGAAQSVATLTWAPVTASITGSSLTVDYYEIWWRPNVGTPWALRTVSDTNSVEMPAWDINFDIQLRVRGRSAAGVFGEWSDFVTHVTNQPAPSLTAPDVPVVTANALGTINAEWNGNIGGAPAPAHLAYVRAEISPNNTTPWSAFGTPLVSAGSTSVDPGLYQQWYIRLVPVDRLGQDGTPSASVSVTTTDPGVDPRIPATPLPPTLSTGSGWSSDGLSLTAWVDVSWNPITADVDGNPLTIVGYEVWGFSSALPQPQQLTITPLTSIRIEDLPPGQSWNFFVIALSYRTVRGAPSAPSTITTSSSNPAMAAPSTPTTASSKGLLQISWDGLLAGATTPPSRFRSVYAEISVTGSGVWKKVGAQFGRGGGDIFVSLPVGDSYIARLTAVDGVGVESAKSASSSSTTIIGVSTGDLNGVLNTMLTEPRIETSPNPEEGVKLFQGGIVAYNSSGDATVVISAEDGSIYFADGMISGNAIVNGTIVASKLEVGSLVATLIASELGNSLNLASNSSVNILVGGAVAGVQSNIDAVDSNLAEMQTYYQFGPDGALITSPESPFAVQITNSQINMLANGVIVSSWNAGSMTVPSLIANETAIIGAHQFRKEGTRTTVRAL